VPPRPGPWLGLNYNSSAGVGKLDDFAKLGVVYDRGGGLEVSAGETPGNAPRFADAIRTSLDAGMVPDIEIGPTTTPSGCTGNPDGSQRCLPRAPAEIDTYVAGFVQTAGAVLHAFPRRQMLFEPMNEPWNWAAPAGTAPGKTAAAQFAAILARLLAAARAAGIPLDQIYVPATGSLDDGTSWVPDLYDAQPCLKPGPSSCGPISGWNAHPYGLPRLATEGIGSLPHLRATMLSGQDNIIVSEVGFCSLDVAGGQECDQNLPDVVGTSVRTATWLAATLDQARVLHRAGWLRALIVWDRTGSGWAMQNPDGSLTAQGSTLARFAGSQ
jgi:hypothetical protein